MPNLHVHLIMHRRIAHCPFVFSVNVCCLESEHGSLPGFLLFART
uniref:Uncharacterized protein n=1 Tax=Arundo donax TaxID=35708 RepID=A0A0A9GHI3_ARUDO